MHRPLPPELDYDPTVLRDDENALALLLKLRDIVVEDWPLDLEVSDFMDSRRTRLPKQLAKRIRRQVRKNEQAIALLERALALEHLQTRTIRDGLNVTESLSQSCRVLTSNALVLASRGEWENAVETLAVNVRAGQMLYRSESDDLCVLVGERLQCSAAEWMLSLERRYHFPPEALQSFLDVVDQARNWREPVVASLRCRFHRVVLPTLANLSDDNDLGRSLDAVLETARPKRSVPWDVGSQLGLRKEGVIALLAGHPCPVDKSETIDLAARLYVEAIRNAARPWDKQHRETATLLMKEVEDWPQEISLHAIDMVSLALGQNQKMVPKRRLTRVRAKLAGVCNPLGKHLVAGLDPNQTLLGHYRWNAKLQGIRTVLAVRICLARKRQWPRSLRQLVEEGILDRVPEDPFGTTLRYAPERRLLWSVGENGRDDGGHEARFDDEVTWEVLRKIRPRGAPEPPPPRSGPVEVPVADDLVWEIPGIE